MKPETHDELNRIANAICALCRHSDTDLDAEDCPCNDCRALIDLANLAEKLEARP